MPRQSLLVRRGPLGVKPAEYIAKTNVNWLESQSNITAKDATQTWLRLTGASKELCEQILQGLITEEISVLSEQQRRGGLAHGCTLLM